MITETGTVASPASLLERLTVSALVVSVFRVTVAVVAAVPSASLIAAAAIEMVSTAASSSVTSRVSVPSAKPEAVAVIVTV